MYLGFRFWVLGEGITVIIHGSQCFPCLGLMKGKKSIGIKIHCKNIFCPRQTDHTLTVPKTLTVWRKVKGKRSVRLPELTLARLTLASEGDVGFLGFFGTLTPTIKTQICAVTTLSPL